MRAKFRRDPTAGSKKVTFKFIRHLCAYLTLCYTEMGGLCIERCEEGRRGGRLEEEDTRQSRVEKTSR